MLPVAVRRCQRLLLGGLVSYNGALARRPMLIKAATGGSLGAAGDLVAQSTTEESINWRRTAGFTSFGLLYVGGFNHYWFGWLTRRFPGSDARAVLSKLAVQQVVANSLFYLPSFYVINGIAMQRTPAQVVQKAENEFVDTLIKTWQTWLPSSFIQFLLVPERYHVLWVSGVSFGWNIYLSLLVHRGHSSPEEQRNIL